MILAVTMTIRFFQSVALALMLIICAAHPTRAAEEAAAELKVALLPILDSLPYYIAQEKGYFENSNVDVFLVPVSSGFERDQLMQSGAIDVMLNEMTTTANFNRDKLQVKILIALRAAYAKAPMFRLLAAPGSGISTPAALADVPIGVSQNTIIEYVTDQLLQAEGLKPEQIVKTSVPVIPERYQLLMQGRIKAAMLPDPLGKSALEAGAVSVIDDSVYPQYSISVFSFALKSIKTKPETIRRFIAAWDKAVSDLNANPEGFRSLLLEKIRVPKNIQASYTIPPFPRKTVPNQRQWDDVMSWMLKKGLLTQALPYTDSVSADFLP